MHCARAIEIWQRIHKWTSLISTLFLLLLCVTGLPLIFKDDIERLLGAGTLPPTSTSVASLDQVAEIALSRCPGYVPLSFYWDEHATGIIRFSLAKAPHVSWKTARWVAINSYSAQIVDDIPSSPRVMDVILTLHKELFAGLPGELFLAAVGLIFLVSLVSGTVLYGPFMRRLVFGAVRRDRSGWIKWLDLHNLLGISTLAWAIVVGATGLVNALSTPLFAKWQSDELPKWLTAYRDKPPLTRLASVESAVRTVQSTLPDAIVWSVVFPYAEGGSPRHYLIWTHGNSPLRSRLFTPVLVDAETGLLTAVLSLPWYLKTLELSRPLHFGDYGGMPMKFIWTLFDIVTIVVLVSGLYLWFRKRTGLGEMQQNAIPEAENVNYDS
jgi:uncharacterized iron-regulated membrane protein